MTKIALAAAIAIISLTSAFAGPRDWSGTTAGYSQDDDARLDHPKGNIQ